MILKAVLVVSCGAAASALAVDIVPARSPRGTLPVQHVAHIYYNLATGERVATLIDGGVRPADDTSSEDLWIADNGIPCADFGQTSSTSAVMDTPACTTCLPSTAINVIYLDWGDIRHDTIVDCVGIGWGTYVADTDQDGDGVGDGAEGFAGTWMWFDADDGFDSGDTRVALVGMTLTNLPGDYRESRNNLAISYTATIDLSGGGPSSGMTFEIGDTDSDSSADFFNPGIGGSSDLDSDLNADFSYALRFTQPGTYDFDNADGDDDWSTGVDGDPGAQGLTLWPIAAGNGDVTTDGSAYSPGSVAPDAFGIEDAFDFYIDPDRDDVFDLIGTFWYGGFHCDIDGDGSFDHTGLNSNPFTQFYMKLYGPTDDTPCAIDLAPPFGVINFFDVNAFVTDFTNRITTADLAPPYGTFDIFDFFEFIRLFNEGCP